MLYFVAGTQLSEDVCKFYNLYDNSELNNDTTSKGYISSKRRLVKAVKLHGVISNGILLPLGTLEWLTNYEKFEEGDTFTHVGDIEICKKYVVPTKVSTQVKGEKQPKANKLKDLIIDNQFRFHHETEHFARNLHLFNDNTEVIITRKKHGSSLILSHVLINTKLNWFQKLMNRFGAGIPTTEYGFIYSSGKPKSRLPKGIKSEDVDWNSPTNSFYSDDIWEKAYQLHEDKVEKGITIYAEIVGKGIQGDAYTYGFDYEIFVYRITQTNVDGNVYEFSWENVKAYCSKYGLRHVEEYFVGKLSDFGKGIDDILEGLKTQYLDKSYPDCKVDEGICIRLRDTHEIFKLKSPKFIEGESKQLEKGIETLES